MHAVERSACDGHRAGSRVAWQETLGTAPCKSHLVVLAVVRKRLSLELSLVEAQSVWKLSSFADVAYLRFQSPLMGLVALQGWWPWHGACWLSLAAWHRVSQISKLQHCECKGAKQVGELNQ